MVGHINAKKKKKIRKSLNQLVDKVSVASSLTKALVMEENIGS